MRPRPPPQNPVLYKMNWSHWCPCVRQKQGCPLEWMEACPKHCLFGSRRYPGPKEAAWCWPGCNLCFPPTQTFVDLCPTPCQPGGSIPASRALLSNLVFLTVPFLQTVLSPWSAFLDSFLTQSALPLHKPKQGQSQQHSKFLNALTQC